MNLLNYIRYLSTSSNSHKVDQKIDKSFPNLFPKEKIDLDIDKVSENKMHIKRILILDSDKQLNLNFLDKFNIEIHHSFSPVEALKIISLSSVITFDAIILNCTGKDIELPSLII